MSKRTLLITGILFLLATQGVAALELQWTGCGITKKAFMQPLADAYTKKSGVAITLKGGGATKGIRETSAKHSAFGGSCRPKVPHTEESSADLTPIAWDALVVIVHPDNPVEGVTIEQLKQVLLGEITHWSDLGGPEEPIELLTRSSKLSGVGYTLRQLLFYNEDQAFKPTQEYPSSGPLEEAVTKNPLALAVTGISSAKKRSVKILNLEGREPSYENISRGDYLLYRPLYLAINSDHPDYEEVKKFVDFALGNEGRAIIKKAGSVPYFDALNLIRRTWKQNRGELL